MGNESLFRRKALDARTTRHLGTIRLAQPIGDRIAAALAVAVIGAIVAFAVIGTYTRHASVPGLLEPVGGTLRLSSPVQGVIVEVRAIEGQRVRQGDVLFTVSGDHRSSGGETTASIARQLDERRAVLERSQRVATERDAVRVQTARERLEALEGELERLERETAINATRRGIAQQNVERFEALSRTGFTSAAQVQARQDDSLVLQAAAEGYARLRTGLLRERAALRGQLADSRLQADGERADIGRQRAALEQERAENDARHATVVSAPRDAVVTGIAVRPGQLAGAGALLATLMPSDTVLEGQVFASTRQAGFVEPGQRVRLRYAAYPYQKFGMGEGVVRSMEKSPYTPQELTSQAAAALTSVGLTGAEPVYRIVVALDRQTIRTYGREQALRAGMVFEADILQDRRRLIEWWLEPLYGIAGR